MKYKYKKGEIIVCVKKNKYYKIRDLYTVKSVVDMSSIPEGLFKPLKLMTDFEIVMYCNSSTFDAAVSFLETARKSDTD